MRRFADLHYACTVAAVFAICGKRTEHIVHALAVLEVLSWIVS